MEEKEKFEMSKVEKTLLQAILETGRSRGVTNVPGSLNALFDESIDSTNSDLPHVMDCDKGMGLRVCNPKFGFVAPIHVVPTDVYGASVDNDVLNKPVELRKVSPKVIDGTLAFQQLLTKCYPGWRKDDIDWDVKGKLAAGDILCGTSLYHCIDKGILSEDRYIEIHERGPLKDGDTIQVRLVIVSFESRSYIVPYWVIPIHFVVGSDGDKTTIYVKAINDINEYARYMYLLSPSVLKAYHSIDQIINNADMSKKCENYAYGSIVEACCKLKAGKCWNEYFAILTLARDKGIKVHNLDLVR